MKHIYSKTVRNVVHKSDLTCQAKSTVRQYFVKRNCRTELVSRIRGENPLLYRINIITGMSAGDSTRIKTPLCVTRLQMCMVQSVVKP